MEHKHEAFSEKLSLFLISLLLAVALLPAGLCRGSPIDQAGAMGVLRRARMRTQVVAVPRTDEEWTALNLGGDGGGSSNVHQTSFIGRMEDDLIKGGLPGQPSGKNLKQYAGYIDVDDSKGRSLFYYFAEAASFPNSKPLLLWLNGGPGCSSLGVGAMVELGPFGVNPDGKTLYSRQFAWNKVANTLFLESPAGVGFSYSNTTTDYSLSGDKRTAEDAYKFLVNWFERFPHYKTRDLYIAGESYAGFYIPELADIIIRRNMEGDPTTKIQLKGVMVGNGIMNDVTDLRGMFDYLWSHALISDETYRGLREACDDNFNSKECDESQARIGTDAGKIDFYNIYSPLCLHSSDPSTKQKAQYLRGHDPCEGDYVFSYLNLPQVQESLHANRTKLPYPWDICSALIKDWKDSPSTMFPVYKRLIDSSLRILLYSGDADAVVPVSSTRYSIDALQLKVVKPWHPWVDEKDDVAGYRVVYEGLTFATVRGAGHEVPRFQPLRALALLKMFIMGDHRH